MSDRIQTLGAAITRVPRPEELPDLVARIARLWAELRAADNELAAELLRKLPGMPPAREGYQEISQLGELLYGEQWTGPLARALGVTSGIVRKWSTGQRPVPPRRLEQIRALAAARRDALAKWT